MGLQSVQQLLAYGARSSLDVSLQILTLRRAAELGGRGLQDLAAEAVAGCVEARAEELKDLVWAMAKLQVDEVPLTFVRRLETPQSLWAIAKLRCHDQPLIESLTEMAQKEFQEPRQLTNMA